MNFETPQNTTTAEQQKRQALAREHLKDGIPHIVFNLIQTTMIDDERGEEWVDNKNNEQNKEAIEQIKANGNEIKEFSGDEKLYFCLDEFDKYSLNYRNCIGTAMIGKSKLNGKEISFITHINASNFDYDDWHRENIKKFDDVLESGIKKLLTDAEIGTIDAVVFGGADWDPSYKEVISRFSKIINEKLGFEPVVLTGPGGHESEDENEEVHPSSDVYLNTQERKIYIVRREVPNKDMDNPYYASQISK